MEPVKVLIVDDHALFRRGIEAVLTNREDIKVVGEASDGFAAVEKSRELHPDVIIMDLNMPRCGGLEAIQAIQAEMPGTNILVMTLSELETNLFAAIKFGASGYLLKRAEPHDLIQAVYYIARGGVIIFPFIANKILKELRKRDEAQKTESTAIPESQEVEVLKLIAQGATVSEASGSLSITEDAVKEHLSNIIRKLHRANRSLATAYAVERGLVRYLK